MSGLLRLVSGAERIAGALAAAILFVIMAIVTVDVAMRYVFNKPFAFAYDLISLYLMVALFYLSVSGAFAHHAHVAVDILHNYMSPALRRVCETIVCGVSALLFALIAFVGFHRAWTAYVAGDAIAGAIDWPAWASIALVPLGAGLLCVRLTLHFFGHLASFFTRTPLIDLPPVSGSPEAMEREMAE